MTMHDLIIRGGTIVDGSGAAPFIADIGIIGDRITAIAAGLPAGASEIDARGRIVTPGFVDVHTHYDGQAIWSGRLSPSSSHGVTTVVMGNCGVGFAPCRASDHAMLINVMEGVEDIPGVVMAEGLAWNWESFPDYLDVLDAGQRDIDVAAYLPHSPLRVFTMGQRGADREPATAADLATMRRLTSEAIAAGALGFATSRLSIHKTADGGSIPTFDADLAELTAICDGMADAGAGTLQIVLDAFRGWDNEFGVIEALVASSGRPATFTLASGNDGPPRWRTVLDRMDAANAGGAQITAQVLPRPIGLIAGLELSVHPFSLCPSYLAIAHLPLADRIAAMRAPAMRAALLSEAPEPGHPFNSLARNWTWMFPMNDPPDYAPPASASIAALAAARGVSPEEIVYDRLLATDGKGLFLAALGNYENGSLDSAREMLVHPACIPALGDGGAHYGAICDASYSTFLLAHWVRDATAPIPLADAVHMLSHKAAQAVGLNDRGLLRPGFKADLNIIDMDRLALPLPHITHDLPAGGRRLDQAATGYDATIVSGQVIRRFDAPTDAMPGRLVRGAQPVPA
ncbi:MAG: N-acyl-D-amino-acid deacylase family protein [Polymorphobacter sp.]